MPQKHCITASALRTAISAPMTELAAGLQLKVITNPELQKVMFELYKTLKADDENRGDFLKFLMEQDELCASYTSDAPDEEAVDALIEGVGGMADKPKGKGGKKKKSAPPPDEPDEDYEPVVEQTV